MRLKIADVHEVCMKHPGMWDAFWQVGKLDGDCIELERADFEAVSQRHQNGTLGTKLHTLLKPVAKAVDTIAGTSFSDCGDCATRELKLNDV